MKKIFSLTFVTVLAIVFAFNINAIIGDNVKFDISLNNIEMLVMGECTAKAKRCDASCTGETYCISYDDGVNCDGVHKSC